MKGPLVLLFLVCAGMQLAAQDSIGKKTPNYFIGSIGGGTSSLYGYSLTTSFSLERKHNLFTLRWNLNNQIGNRKNEFLRVFTYNDRFRDIAFLYGCTFRNSWLRLSASAGISYYKYLDKSLGKMTPAFLATTWDIDKRVYEGISIAGQMEALFIFNENFGMSFSFLGNWGGKINMGGVALNLAFGILECE